MESNEDERSIGGPSRRRGGARGHPARTPYDRPQPVQAGGAPKPSEPAKQPRAAGESLLTTLWRPFSALPQKVPARSSLLSVFLLPQHNHHWMSGGVTSCLLLAATSLMPAAIRLEQAIATVRLMAGCLFACRR